MYLSLFLPFAVLNAFFAISKQDNSAFMRTTSWVPLVQPLSVRCALESLSEGYLTARAVSMRADVYVSVCDERCASKSVSACISARDLCHSWLILQYVAFLAGSARLLLSIWVRGSSTQCAHSGIACRARGAWQQKLKRAPRNDVRSTSAPVPSTEKQYVAPTLRTMESGTNAQWNESRPSLHLCPVPT